MNVAQWLNAIDLGQYEALFREHEIDAGVLPDLVEADLEKIGVPLGHRKRLMRAIAALSAGETPPSAAKPASAQPSPSARQGSRCRGRTAASHQSCSSTSSARRALSPSSTPKTGATSSTPISTRRRRAVTGFGGHVLESGSATG